ncbi:hypothetical protein JCM3766R1_005591 [Sporobolomyces carnicolor]
MAPPYLYPAPPPSSPTFEFGSTSSFFLNLPTPAPVQGGSFSDVDMQLEAPSFNSPPLVPFSFPRRTVSASTPSSTCPSSPPLVALELSSPDFSTTASTSSSPTRAQRPVGHPLHTTSKLRLEMTPLLPTFHLPQPDIDMSPPWTTADLAGPPPVAPSAPVLAPSPMFKGRKNSLVALPVAPPSPPLTPSEELPAFDWGAESRGRSTEVTPVAAKRRRVV